MWLCRPGELYRCPDRPRRHALERLPEFFERLARRLGRRYALPGRIGVGTAPPCDHRKTAVIGDRTVEQRSEEHTSELQSLMRISYAVFCLKKKNKTRQLDQTHMSTPTDTTQ